MQTLPGNHSVHRLQPVRDRRPLAFISPRFADHLRHSRPK
jgi:hypothetical protein